MPPTNRLTDEQLAELEVLQRNADLDRLVSTHILSTGYTHLANLTEEIDTPPGPRGRCIAMTYKEWSDYIAAGMNALPALIAEVRELRREREEAVSLMRAERFACTGDDFVSHIRNVLQANRINQDTSVQAVSTLAELRRDKERLDWIGRTYDYDIGIGLRTEARGLLRNSVGNWSCGNNVLGGWFQAPTVRAAIDKAMAKDPNGTD